MFTVPLCPIRQAIATMLEGNAALQNLDVSWNNLRQESAAAIGRSLCLNRGLKSLNLAHNAFNDTPSQEVGDSLRVNETLKVSAAGQWTQEILATRVTETNRSQKSNGT